MKSSVELELKYSIIDVSVVQRLLALQSVGPYKVAGFREQVIHDTYYDTATRVFAARHFAYRFRRRDGKSSVELKSTDKAEGNIHRRVEIGLRTESPTQIDIWPDSPERDFIAGILGNEELIPLVHIEQTRHAAPLLLGESEVAEVSVDEVCWSVGGRKSRGWVLEIEMAAVASQSDLELIHDELKAFPELLPEHVSKYELGLAMVQS
ncbi:MAG: CYTH domain-containing protein [Chloroflexi bacterium]|nr:CYTH domain-containing protein [Chloroflexota bacterium]